MVRIVLPRSGRAAIPASVVKEVFARDGLCCRYCAYRHRDPARFHLEHCVARSAGGKDVASNLVVACVRCNKLKGVRTWTPIPLATLKTIRRPLEPFAVLRRQGMTTQEAATRLRRAHAQRKKHAGITKP